MSNLYKTRVITKIIYFRSVIYTFYHNQFFVFRLWSAPVLQNCLSPFFQFIRLNNAKKPYRFKQLNWLLLVSKWTINWELVSFSNFFRWTTNFWCVVWITIKLGAVCIFFLGCWRPCAKLFIFTSSKFPLQLQRVVGGCVNGSSDTQLRKAVKQWMMVYLVSL